MAAELPHDMILHIIMQLPLKYAIRSCILNKRIYNVISTPKFVRDHHALLSSSSPSSSNPIIFHNSFIFHKPSAKFTTINSPVRKSITLADQDMLLLDSCNGILLLYGRQSALYCVFNPFTGGVMFLNYDIKRPHWWGLAVEIPSNNNAPATSSNSSFDFKLVELQTKKLGARGHTRLLFLVLVPSRDRGLVKKEFNLDYEGSFTPLIGPGRRPVYGHGSLHWLGVGATAIAAFDVESGRARVMGGPVRDAIDCWYSGIWFGLAQGSLQFIRRDRWEEVIVHSHNCLTHEWRVAHRIEIPNMGGSGLPVPMFFDGLQKVFFHSVEGDKNVEEIYVHDLSVGKWIKSGEVEVLGDFSDWRYMEYFPTTVKVSDVYLSNMLAQRRSTKKWLCLLQLQRFLLDCDPWQI